MVSQATVHQFIIRFVGIWKPTFGCGQEPIPSNRLLVWQKKHSVVLEKKTQLKETGVFKIILFYLFTCFLPSSFYFIKRE